jgi:hypothetical protein
MTKQNMFYKLVLEKMMKKSTAAIIFVLIASGPVFNAQAEELSIYDVQYTTNPDGTSTQDGNLIDCSGGIVIHKFVGSRSRLILQDPDHPDGWGGIMAKDTLGAGVFDNINIGDRISLTNVLVEDYKGTTFLQYIPDNDPNYYLVSTNNPLPKSLPVSIDEIAAPIEGIDQWVVFDHNCEKYESMLIEIIDVTVQDLGYGKAYDNYILEIADDPNITCWASDYMNDDSTAIYHDYIQIGQGFCSVSGILEQYNAERDGIYYDYYQLLTLKTESFTITQTADFDDDCDVDLTDFSAFASWWLMSGCEGFDFCNGADLSENGSVDIFDLNIFTDNWWEGKIYDPINN